MKRRSRHGLPKLMVCLLSAVTGHAHSQEPGDLNDNPVAEAESQFLFINMLEFLGEFETDTGEWISPDILGNDAFADLDGVNGDSDGDVRAETRVLSVQGNDDND